MFIFFVFRNPHHFKEFKHENLAALLRSGDSSHQSENLKEQLKIYAEIEKLLSKQNNEETSKKPEKIGPSAEKNPPIISLPKSTESKPKRARSASPGDDSAASGGKKMAPTPRAKSRIEARLEAAAPFNFFLTKVKDNPATHNDNHRCGTVSVDKF